MKKVKPVIERILSKIEIVTESGCWIWTGTLDKKGYGRLWVGSHTDGTRKNARAHRLSYEIFNGEIGDLLVLHDCDVSCCVNPDHLHLGTHSDNLTEMYKRKRRKIYGVFPNAKSAHSFT